MAEKRKRASAKGKFTRQETHLRGLIDIQGDKSIVAPAYQKFVDCWNQLEEAHEEFIAVEDIDVETHDDGEKYLEDLSVRYGTLVQQYAEFLKKSGEIDQAIQKEADEGARAVEEASRRQIEAERKAADAELLKQQLERKFASSKAELDAGIAAFKGLVVGLKDSVSNSSDSIKLHELKNAEVEFNSLKDQLVKLAGVDDTKDIEDIRTKFVDHAESTYVEFKNSVVRNMKDVSSKTSGGDQNFLTKKEPVKLPDFVGDEKCSPSPFLTFPIWLKQWKGMIDDYEEKFCDRLLWDKLDVVARARIAGFETDYEEALKHLEQYYGDSTKVVKCVVKQIRDPDSISENNYRGLVEYSTILEQNYNRLLSMNLEHEMSNHSIMSVIVKKFPCSIEERWHEHLLDRKDEEQNDGETVKPFPLFMKWLSRQKQKWTQMISPEMEESESSFYGNSGGHSSGVLRLWRIRSYPQALSKGEEARWWFCQTPSSSESEEVSLCFSQG